MAAIGASAFSGQAIFGLATWSRLSKAIYFMCFYNASLAKEKPLAEGMKALQLLQELVKKGNFRQ